MPRVFAARPSGAQASHNNIDGRRNVVRRSARLQLVRAEKERAAAALIATPVWLQLLLHRWRPK